jgi:hypothetical protein
VAKGALAALQAGRGDEHDRIVADTAARLPHVDALVLGQFSPARAAKAIPAVNGRVPKRSPRACSAAAPRWWGWNSSELITPLVPPSSHRLSRSPSHLRRHPSFDLLSRATKSRTARENAHVRQTLRARSGPGDRNTALEFGPTSPAGRRSCPRPAARSGAAAARAAAKPGNAGSPARDGQFAARAPCAPPDCDAT